MQPRKALWDWLGLLAALAIPVVVGIGAAWFTAQQAKVSDAENKDNQREAALQAYIDKMSELLLHAGLRDSAEGDEVRSIARVRTLTVLRGLDALRKANVLQFLHESGLVDKNERIIDLSDAYTKLRIYLSDAADLRGSDFTLTNLSGSRLRWANLSGAYLSEADLSGADLRGASFLETNLSGSRLSGSNLSGTYLSRANLRWADLSGADLSGADLSGSDLRWADLSGSDLSGSDLSGANLSGSNLSGSNLSGSDLSGSDLSGSDLSGSDLSGANLTWANLSGSDLMGANLKDATGITTKELEKQAASLKGATMPDGSIHP